jgi:AraC-type DNA-binding domain-containing proteins
MNNHMLPNNRYNFSDFTISIGNIDSRLVRGKIESGKIVFSDLFSSIKRETKDVDYRNDDGTFIENLIITVQNRITDGSFDFKKFAREMKVSKSTLHRRTNQLVGATPCKLISLYRIEMAKQLLLDDTLNISEVAYKIGFNDPRYFSRCFKTETGLSPKEYRESIKPKIKSTESWNQDDLFVKKALKTLETKIADGNLSFDQFATEMNVSKASLYRKLKSVSGLSPCEFIRSVRIKRSTQLLAKHSNISEVAFAVGFNDSKYFARCFKSELGLTPTQYQELLAC